MITPSRLRLARLRKGWTILQLSKDSGVAVRTLSAIENGSHQPRVATMQQLAASLEVSPAFLSGDEIETLAPDSVSFRKLSKTSAGRRDAALAAGRLAIEVSRWIEQRFVLPAPDLPTLGMHAPETAANIVRERWGLGEHPIPNMVHLVEARGVRVFSLVTDCREIDAFSVLLDGQPYVFVDTAKSGERQRFDIAHELGHLLLHCEDSRAHGRDKELEANRFAAALLMPARSVVAMSGRDLSLERLLAVKAHWKVAAIAVAHRLHELGVLSDWAYRQTCITLSKLGYRNTEPQGMRPETSQVLAKVFRALRQDGVGLSGVAADLAITDEEISRHVFGLMPTSLNGGGELSPRRARLAIVH